MSEAPERHPMMELDAAVRLAVVGLGRAFEQFHLPALLDSTEARLVGVWDADHERCAWGREHLPGVPVAYDFEHLLEQRPEALLLLAPPEEHPSLAIAALRAGLHVLVDPPIAADRAQGSRMADAARAARRRLQVGYNRRFREPYRRLKARLPSIGSDAHIAFELTLPDEGAPVDDVLAQQADLLRWMLGATPARLRIGARSADQIECELEFPGGVTARCTAERGSYREWLVLTLAGTAFTASGTVFREGSNAASEGRQRLALFADKASAGIARVMGRSDVTAESLVTQLKDFAAAVRGRAASGAGPSDGLAALAVVEAARRGATSSDWEPVS